MSAAQRATRTAVAGARAAATQDRADAAVRRYTELRGRGYTHHLALCEVVKEMAREPCTNAVLGAVVRAVIATHETERSGRL